MTSRIPANISEITFDVIIIGAGINGAGIARDAAMRGLQVLLLDKGDIAGGTTSWSTRLIHGGLRYLEYAELGLVRESLRERETLLKIAPHLVKAIPILLPLYRQAARGPLTIRAGMIAYDLLSFDKSLPRHRMLSRTEVLAQAPGLNANGLIGGAIYYDAQVEFAERLVVENVLSAEHHGTTVITYAKVQKFTAEGNALRKLEFTDVLNGKAYATRGRLIVNAAGPWVDQVLENAPQPSPQLIGGTKGSHIIVTPFSGAPRSALYIEAQSDRRPLFIIPWNGNYLIGTTDSRYEGDLDKVEAEDSELNYLLDETNRAIPAANLTRDAILFTYSGIRPLPFAGHKDEQRITRRHFVRPHPSFGNLLSIVGGKLTTYRSLAEQAVDLIFRKLEESSPKCTTGQMGLPGAATSDFAAFSKDFKRGSLPEVIGNRLLRIYGTRSAAILKLVEEAPQLAEVFDAETGAIAAEVVFTFKHELAQTVSDCLLRRTMVGLNSECGLGAVEAAARIAQKHMGWSNERTAGEIANHRKAVLRFLPKTSW